jgi:hypothetical protein
MALSGFLLLTIGGIASRLSENWSPVCAASALHYTRRPLVHAERREFNGSRENFLGSENCLDRDSLKNPIASTGWCTN